MVDTCNHHIQRTLQFWPRRRDVGGRAFGPNPQAVGLGKLVVVVGADGHPLHRAGHFVAVGVFGRVQAGEERAGARKLVAFVKALDGPHAVVGCAAQNGVAHRGRATAVLDVVADGIAAA